MRDNGSTATWYGESLESSDSFLDGRVGAEESDERSTTEWVHDEEALGCRAPERDRAPTIRDLELLQGRREGQGLTDRFGPAVVRLILAAAGDRQLDQERRDRGEDHADERNQDCGTV